MLTGQPTNGKQGTIGWFISVSMVFCATSLIVMPWDVPISIRSTLHSLPGDVRRIVDLSEIFAHGFGVLIALFAIPMLAPEKRRFVPRFAMLAILPGLVAQLIKLFVIRNRPAKYWPELLDATSTWQGLSLGNSGYDFQSFPSAHTATVVGMAVGLCWLFPRGRYLFISLAFLAGFQRVASSAHWPSDVLAGAAIGIATCALVMHAPILQGIFHRLEKTAIKTVMVQREK